MRAISFSLLKRRLVAAAILDCLLLCPLQGLAAFFCRLFKGPTITIKCIRNSYNSLLLRDPERAAEMSGKINNKKKTVNHQFGSLEEQLSAASPFCFFLGKEKKVDAGYISSFC